MLQRQRQLFAQVHRFVDAGLAALAFWLAHWLRGMSHATMVWERPDIQPFSDYAGLLLVIIPAAPFILQFQGYYNRPLMASRRRTLWQLLWGSMLTVLLLILISFLIRSQPARGVILLFGPVNFVLMALKEEVVRRWMLSGPGRAQLRRRLIVVGARSDTGRLRQELLDPSNPNLEVVAEVDLNETAVEQFLALLHDHAVNAVLLTAKHTYFGQVEKVIAACELEGVEVWLMADFFKTRISQTIVDDFQGRPMLVFRCTLDTSWQALVKQLLDLVGASLLVLVFSPVMLSAALLIRLTSPGPILFRQQRCGLNGRPFTMLKFRSMTSDAEQRKHELELLNEMSGPVFKLANDPRVTPVGRLLRKFSIDEFPQLFNVLQGEMSIVGPRPLPIDEVARFDDLAHRRRLSVRPGITCLWQVSGRSNLSDFKDWVRLDLEYIDNWSLWLDLKILVRTVPVVLMGTGAR